VSTRLAEPPPDTRAPRGGPDWTELVRLRRWRQVRDLLRRLEGETISARAARAAPRPAPTSRFAPPSYVVFVRRHQLEEGRFVLVQLAFEGPSTAELRRRPSALRRAAAVTLAGIMLTITLAAAATADGPSSSPGRRACAHPVPWASIMCDASPDQ
jgi:hypothetical protein